MLRAQAVGAIPISTRHLDSVLPVTSGRHDLGPPPTNISARGSPEVRRKWLNAVVAATSRSSAFLRSHRAAMRTWARSTLEAQDAAARWDAAFQRQAFREPVSDGEVATGDGKVATGGMRARTRDYGRDSDSVTAEQAARVLSEPPSPPFSPPPSPLTLPLPSSLPSSPPSSSPPASLASQSSRPSPSLAVLEDQIVDLQAQARLLADDLSRSSPSVRRVRCNHNPSCIALTCIHTHLPLHA